MAFFNNARPKTPVNWKTNLIAVWISQFISLSAFYFCLPFLPLYLKQKNIVPVEDTALWSGVFIASASVSMMIMSPIWGGLGDRYGRKMMLVRANLAGAFALYLMSVVDNMEGLIALRLLQGAFTGTVPSAQSLVAAATPDKHQGFALGLMMASINAASTAGMFLGGIYAAHYGAEASFRMAGYLLGAATLIVVVMVRENFTAPASLTGNTRSARIRRRQAGVRQLRSSAPVLLGVAFLALVMTYDGPYMALYVETLYHPDPAAAAAAGVEGAVFGITGTINAVASAIAIGGSILISYIMDKNAPKWAWAAIALGGVLGICWINWRPTIAGLTAGRSVFLFFTSGLSSVLVVLLSRMTPGEKRGSAMGWAVTARCVGWMAAPLAAGWLAQDMGYGAAYWLLAAVCVPLVPFFPWLAARYPEAFGGGPEEEDKDAVFDEVVLPPQSMPVTARASARLFTREKAAEEKGATRGRPDVPE